MFKLGKKTPKTSNYHNVKLGWQLKNGAVVITCKSVEVWTNEDLDNKTK